MFIIHFFYILSFSFHLYDLSPARFNRPCGFMCLMKDNIAHLQKKKDQDISQSDAFAIKDVMHLHQVTSRSNKQSQYGCCAVLLWVTHIEGCIWPLHCTLHIFSIFNCFNHNTVIAYELLCQSTKRYKQTKQHWQKKCLLVERKSSAIMHIILY